MDSVDGLVNADRKAEVVGDAVAHQVDEDVTHGVSLLSTVEDAITSDLLLSFEVSVRQFTHLLS